MEADFELSSHEIDVFKEIGSIGSGNAATALSQMINRKVAVRPIKTELIRIEEVPEEIGGAESLVMGVYLRILGDMTGDAVYLHSKEDAFKLINMVSGNHPDSEPNIPSDEQISVYKEMSNIFTGSYLNAISKLLGIILIPSVPHYASDMLGSLIDFVLSEIGTKVDKLLLIKTELVIGESEIVGGYLMIFNSDSLDKMLDIVNHKFNYGN